jgi:hypothetical protein
MGLDGAQLSMAPGDYEQIERARRVAWRRMLQSLWGSTEHEERTRHLKELTERRATYLRDLLTRLPFRWHIEHAYTPNETAGYGGADHIIVDESLRMGRLHREPGDADLPSSRSAWSSPMQGAGASTISKLAYSLSSRKVVTYRASPSQVTVSAAACGSLLYAHSRTSSSS